MGAIARRRERAAARGDAMRCVRTARRCSLRPPAHDSPPPQTLPHAPAPSTSPAPDCCAEHGASLQHLGSGAAQAAARSRRQGPTLRSVRLRGRSATRRVPTSRQRQPLCAASSPPGPSQHCLVHAGPPCQAGGQHGWAGFLQPALAASPVVAAVAASCETGCGFWSAADRSCDCSSYRRLRWGAPHGMPASDRVLAARMGHGRQPHAQAMRSEKRRSLRAPDHSAPPPAYFSDPRFVNKSSAWSPPRCNNPLQPVG